MTRQEQINAIKFAFYDLQQLDLQDGFRDVAERLYQMNLDSEKQHRQHASGNEGITKVIAAKLFTVSHLLDGDADPDRFSVDDILSIRNEVLYAQAYAKRFHVALVHAFGRAMRQTRYKPSQNLPRGAGQ